jgi:hypothetical protein
MEIILVLIIAGATVGLARYDSTRRNHTPEIALAILKKIDSMPSPWIWPSDLKEADILEAMVYHGYVDATEDSKGRLDLTIPAKGKMKLRWGKS